MSAHFKLRGAEDDWRRAQAQLEECHQTWLTARVNEDHDPATFIDSSVALAIASHMEILCHQRFREAQIESIRADLERESILTSVGRDGATLVPADEGGLPGPGRAPVPESGIGAARPTYLEESA